MRKAGMPESRLLSVKRGHALIRPTTNLRLRMIHPLQIRAELRTSSVRNCQKTLIGVTGNGYNGTSWPRLISRDGSAPPEFQG
jgi:hypothetical protein